MRAGKRVLVWCMLAAGMFLLAGGEARGDGKFFEMASKKAPTIPQQRAIVRYKDGVERLLIESALEGEGTEFGWVIPLPSPPTKLEKASAGFLNTLAIEMQPKITHRAAVGPVLWLSATVTLCALATLAKSKRPMENVINALAVCATLLFVAALFMPALHSGRGRVERIEGVRVRESVAIGSYDVTVLEADKASGLDQWLTSNGYAGLGNEGQEIVTDYIREGWCFVAAKLRREAEGYSEAHPIEMTFTAEKAIYPMRLTKLADCDVYVDLFVIGPESARARKMVCEASRKSRDSGERVLEAHPRAKDYLWYGCMISRLCGTMRPVDMDEDIVFSWVGQKPETKHYYSVEGAAHTAVNWGLFMWDGLLVVGLVLLKMRSTDDTWRKDAWRSVILPAGIVALITTGVAYAMAPKVEVNVRSVKEFVRQVQAPHEMRNVMGILSRDTDGFRGKTREEVEEIIEEYFVREEVKNVFTGLPIRQEDSPGNYVLLTDKRGIVLRWYGKSMSPSDVVLTDVD